ANAVKITQTTGQATLDLESEPGDPLGQGKGKFTIKSPAEIALTRWNNGTVPALTFRVNSTQQGVWQLAFSAPALEVGKLYVDADNFTLSSPALNGIIVLNQRNGSCNNSAGQFTVVQQAPTVIVTFTFTCDRTIGKTLKGTLTFIPLSQLTPTPSPDP